MSNGTIIFITIICVAFHAAIAWVFYYVYGWAASINVTLAASVPYWTWMVVDAHIKNKSK